jgi:hypothetical protein
VTEVAWGGAKWVADTGEDRYRRSVYTFRKRTAPFAMYDAFDAPSGESCLARRDVSNTPLQALTLLNDTMFVEAAQALGQSLAARTGSDEDRVEYAVRRVLNRPPAPEELQPFLRFVARQRERFAQGELDATAISGRSSAHPQAQPASGAGVPASHVEDAVWTTLARALFSLDETITRK